MAEDTISIKGYLLNKENVTAEDVMTVLRTSDNKVMIPALAASELLLSVGSIWDANFLDPELPRVPDSLKEDAKAFLSYLEEHAAHLIKDMRDSLGRTPEEAVAYAQNLHSEVDEIKRQVIADLKKD